MRIWNFIRNLLSRNRKIASMAASTVMVLLIGTIDSLAGTEISLSAFYLIPIFVSSYYCGATAGFAISFASILVYLIGDKILSIQYVKSATPYWNTGVRFILFATVTYAVAKRRSAEDQLAKSEERFRLLVEGAKEYAILMLDHQGLIESWNSGAQRIFGYVSSEMIGKHLSSLYLSKEVEAGKPHEDLKRTREHGIISFEGWCRKKDRSQFWADVTLTSLAEAGRNKPGYALITRDITERKEAEKTIQLFAQLHEVDRAILAATSAEALAEEALDHIRELVPFQFATLTRFDDDSGLISFLAAKAIDERPFTAMPVVLENPDYDDLDSLKTGKVIHVADMFGVTRSPLVSVLPFEALRCYVLVPLISQSNFVGSVNFGSSLPSAFTLENIEVTTEIANQVALALRNVHLFEKLRTANQSLQLLNQKLLNTQESEKRNLARELHDELGQALTALKIQLEEVQAGLQDTIRCKKLNEATFLVDKILEEIRGLSLDLRPLMLDDLGLVAALRWYASTRAQLGGFSLHLEVQPISFPLSTELETVCFRVAQEALTNVVRHAGAKHVHIELLTFDHGVFLSIKDDGKGFDVQQAQERTLKGENFGLLGMKERVSLAGGNLEIESVPNCGTEVRVHLPFHHEVGAIV